MGWTAASLDLRWQRGQQGPACGARWRAPSQECGGAQGWWGKRLGGCVSDHGEQRGVQNPEAGCVTAWEPGTEGSKAPRELDRGPLCSKTRRRLTKAMWEHVRGRQGHPPFPEPGPSTVGRCLQGEVLPGAPPCVLANAPLETSVCRSSPPHAMAPASVSRPLNPVPVAGRAHTASGDGEVLSGRHPVLVETVTVHPGPGGLEALRA